MIATQELQKEHKAVELSLQLLDRIMEKLHAEPDPVDLGHLEELLEFFHVFVDQCHHGKEETFLFPVLEKSGVKKQDGPIKMLLSDHERGRRYIEQLKSLIPELQKADKSAVTDAKKIVKSFVALMQRHIQKEDTVLFPLADDRLTEKQQTDMVHEFNRLEQEKIGPGKHEKYHDMIDRLSSQY